MAKANDALKLALGKPEFRDIDGEKEDYSTQLYSALFYVHNVVEYKTLKKETLAFVGKHLADSVDTDTLKKLSDSWFASVGKFCYISEYGGKLTEKHMESIERMVNEMISSNTARQEAAAAKAEDEEEKAPTVVTNKPGIQDYMREKAMEVCGEFEEIFDEYNANPAKVELNQTPRAIMQAEQLKAGHLRFVIQAYEPMVAELTEALDGKDQELRDAYGFLTKPQLRKLLAYVESIISDATFLKNANVTQRKPRKKRAVDIGKLVSKLKYQELGEGVASEKPIHIMGAKEVWVYNTKTRKLGHYIAFDEQGLTVKGTSIKNFAEKSVQRNIRRGADFSLAKFVKGNKSGRNRIYKELKGIETKLNGRTNDHTLILKVEK